MIVDAVRCVRACRLDGASRQSQMQSASRSHPLISTSQSLTHKHGLCKVKKKTWADGRKKVKAQRWLGLGRSRPSQLLLSVPWKRAGVENPAPASPGASQLLLFPSVIRGWRWKEVEQLKRRRSPPLPSPRRLAPILFCCVVCGLWYSPYPTSTTRVTPSARTTVATTVATTVVYRRSHPPKQATSNNHRLPSFTSAIHTSPQRRPRNDTNDAATTPNTTILGSTHPRCNCCTRHGSPWLFRAEVVRNSSRSLTRKSLWVSAVACRLVGPPVPSDSKVSRTSETLGMRMAL